MNLFTSRRLAAFLAPATLVTVLQATAVLPAGPAAAAAPATGVVIPAPQAVTSTGAAASITAASRIVYPTGLGLDDYAAALAQEVGALTGTAPTLAAGDTAVPGDISVTEAGSSHDGSYSLTVDGVVTLSAGNQNGLANASASLLQLLQANRTIPGTVITDAPSTAYRSVMVDTARGYWSIQDLQNEIELCHLYKIDYLHLHLTDDQNFMFPSAAYPKLSSQNDSGHPAYTLGELTALDKYAAARGVSLIPELDVPGHSAKMVQQYPAVFGGTGSTIDVTLPGSRTAVKTIIGEMLDVFTHTPYFHFGADESTASGSDFASFINDLDGYVTGRGKTSIVWEGFSRSIQSQVNHDVVIENWVNSFYPFDQEIADGFTVINAGWNPLYLVAPAWGAYTLPQSSLYGFSKYTSNGVSVAPTNRVMGGSVASWGFNGANGQVPTRLAVPPIAAKLWNPAAETDFAGFTARLAGTDAALAKLVSTATQWGVHKVRADYSGLDPQLGGSGAGVKLAVDGSGNVWVVTATGLLHQWDGSRWHAVTGPGQSTGITDVAVGANGTVAVILASGDIWARVNGTWTATGGQGKSIAVSANGDIWTVSTTGTPWQYTNGTWTAHSQGQTATTIAAGAGNTVAITTAANGEIMLWSNGSWTDTGGQGTALSIDGLGSIWARSTDDHLWQRSGTTWTMRMDNRGTGGLQAFAAAGNGQLYALGN
ncbi:family 20 glycosylhydrolase [Kitasatospora acidiphila]|uniref:beta-N-acetylhexosaminidase n=1 Tax=Kitasatospora acidiphila TaxID=2567942 RepID=A0A540W1D5_9ACTN|nr:family 20 glycosylhydrolase [Kitasatospora acidiphila]TQF02826.1 family 20 glycosylhydrolase [Kitasatospora acidiphila]